MKQNTVFLTVEPGDIFMFGDYVFFPEENEGNTVIDFFDAGKYDWNTSYIMLRNILRAIGPEYKVWVWRIIQMRKILFILDSSLTFRRMCTRLHVLRAC